MVSAKSSQKILPQKSLTLRQKTDLSLKAGTPTKSLQGKFDFSEKITKNITLYARWTENSGSEWVNPFTDVKETDWFYNNVRYAAENELMRGTSDTTFEPGGKITRAMLVTILWRAAGKPQTDYAMTFSDIAPKVTMQRLLGGRQAKVSLTDIPIHSLLPTIL